MKFEDINYEILDELAKKHGDTFYIIDTDLFEKNYHEMLSAFRKYYADTNIAYSYKTNYLPDLCRRIDRMGGYAEIVSEMEWWLSRHISVPDEKVYYNGPYKKADVIEEFLLSGGHLNIDAEYEAEIVKEVAKKYPDKAIKVGLRVLADIGQDESSRFGLDVEDGTFRRVFDELTENSNISIVGIHIHLPFRNLDTFAPRIDVLRKVLQVIPEDIKFEYVSLGGGYMGAVDPELAGEFTFTPPTYDDYAKIIAGEFAGIFSDSKNSPQLIIEPGSALVANTMRLVTRVVNIKHSRDRYIATLTGSTYNMNPSVKGVRRTIDVYSQKFANDDNGNDKYESLDMAGYTCIEGDYLYKGYQGNLQRNDFVVFRNVGSYSIVMKPPFILPDVAILNISDNYSVVKNVQRVIDVFINMIQ